MRVRIQYAFALLLAFAAVSTASAVAQHRLPHKHMPLPQANSQRAPNWRSTIPTCAATPLRATAAAST